MGVRYICPRCRTDLMAHLSWDLDKCPSCGVPLVRSRARFAFVKHELQQGIYIGFLCAFATAVLMAVAAGVVGRLGAALPAFVVAPAGVVFFVAPILYYCRLAGRPTRPWRVIDRARWEMRGSVICVAISWLPRSWLPAFVGRAAPNCKG